MKTRFAIALVIPVLLIAGCQRDDAKEPLAISGKLFNFNYRVATATYVLTLRRQAALPEESFVETMFENPAGGEPLMTREKIFPFWEKVSLQSPPVHCVVKNRPYHVAIRIVSTDGTLIQALDTTVTSTLDQTVLPAKPLVVGPFYDRNPEVFETGAKPDYRPEVGCKA